MNYLIFMDSKIILGRILQKFIEQGFSKYQDYNLFKFVAVNNKSLVILRENGRNATIPFNKLIIGIEAYQSSPDLYDDNTTALRNVGIIHITSPIFSLLHMLPKDAYLL